MWNWVNFIAYNILTWEMGVKLIYDVVFNLKSNVCMNLDIYSIGIKVTNV
jgi:hypothetical protein